MQEAQQTIQLSASGQFNTPPAVQGLLKWQMGTGLSLIVSNGELHLAICHDISMHTFGRNFCKQASELGITPK